MIIKKIQGKGASTWGILDFSPAWKIPYGSKADALAEDEFFLETKFSTLCA